MNIEFKNSVFDALKGFAILIIFIMHVYHFVPFGGLFSNFILMGTIGVQIFFILSGYLLAFNYSSFDNFKSILFFYLRRLKRIYPIFFFFTFINLFFFGFHERRHSYGDLNIEVVLSHIFLYGGWSYKTFNAILDGSWFIFAITFCYFLFPIIYSKNFTWSKGIQYYIFFRIISLLTVICNYKLMQDSIVDDKFFYLFNSYNYYFPLNHVSEFIIGLILFKLIQSCEHSTNKNFAVFYLLFFLFVFYFSKTNGGRLPVNIQNSICALFFILGSVKFPIKVFNNIFFRYLGKRSLSIFLNHMIIINLTFSNFSNIYPNKFYNFLIFSVLTFVLSLFIAEITYRIFEKKPNFFISNSAKEVVS